MMDKHQQLAGILCQLTTDLLTNNTIDYNGLNLEKIRLNCRIGSGHATYCKYDARQQLFTITYGKKMIKSKFGDYQITHWLTYREIIKHNYFDGNTSLLNVLTHTVCHEFSHLIQQHFKWHIKGSVHNDKFYNILEHFYDTGVAAEIRDRLSEACKTQKISLRQIKEPTQLPDNESINFSLNDTVCFIHKNKTIKGKITKINRKTIVITTGRLFNQTLWRVPKSLVQPLDIK